MTNHEPSLLLYAQIGSVNTTATHALSLLLLLPEIMKETTTKFNKLLPISYESQLIVVYEMIPASEGA
jgi:hypothetical protein